MVFSPICLSSSEFTPGALSEFSPATSEFSPPEEEGNEEEIHLSLVRNDVLVLSGSLFECRLALEGEIRHYYRLGAPVPTCAI